MEEEDMFSLELAARDDDGPNENDEPSVAW